MTAKKAIADERGRPSRPPARAGAARADPRDSVARVPAHPHDHERDDADGRRADDRLQALLLPLWQLLVDDLQRDADGEADGGRGGDAEPHPAQRVGPPLLAQEGGDDADDERRLDALAQADDERRKHAIASSLR